MADARTARFVARFLAHLRSGRPQPAALARTKREFAQPGGRYEAPLHWAAFALWGA